MPCVWWRWDAHQRLPRHEPQRHQTHGIGDEEPARRPRPWDDEGETFEPPSLWRQELCGSEQAEDGERGPHRGDPTTAFYEKRRPAVKPDTATLIERMLSGDRLALARLITQVENRTAALPAIMKAVYPHAHGAYVVGVTGPPGAGKSTVADRLTARPPAGGGTGGRVAVDPSRPFTGGAGLGDRIRMQTHALDPGV